MPPSSGQIGALQKIVAHGRCRSRLKQFKPIDSEVLLLHKTRVYVSPWM